MSKKFLALMLLLPLQALGQNTVTLTPSVTSGAGTITTDLSWDTNPRLTSGMPCVASGHPDWTGPKPGFGSQPGLVIASSGTLPLQLTCTFPGQSIVTFTWTPATTNEDGTPYNNPKLTRIRYSFNPGFTGNETCNTADVTCVDVDDTTTPRPSMHTVTGITQTGTLKAVALHISQLDVFSLPSGIAQKVFTGSIDVTQTVAITVNPRPLSPGGFGIE